MKFFLFIALLNIGFLIGNSVIPNSLFAGSLEFTTVGIVEETDPQWNYQYYGFEPLFWNNKEIPIEKRIAVINYVISRLEFIKYTCPKLEEKISLEGKEKNIKEIIAMVERQLNSKLPVVYNCNYEIKHTFKIEDYPVYEIIEAICLGAGYDPIYYKDKIEIRDRQ